MARNTTTTTTTTEEDKHTDKSDAEKNNPSFSDFFDTPKEVVDVVNLMDTFILKPVISDTTNTGLISELTLNNDNKVESMYSDCSGDTRSFTKLEKMERSEI